jgi:hypothetical protein
MSRLLDDFLYRTTLLTVVRGKCGYWEPKLRHESVRLTGGEWFGESSRGRECPYAPQDQCPTCQGRGFHELRGPAAEQAALDGLPVEMSGGEKVARKPCPPCRGSGYVPGPHWPYRFPQPPPLRVRS